MHPATFDRLTRTLRVAIIEDEDLFRDLLSGSLQVEADLEVVGAFGTADTALTAIPALHPDVVLMDVQLGGELDGIHLGLELRRRLRQLGIVVLSNHADVRFLAPLPEADVDGWSYLLKSSVRSRTVLARAIRACAQGEVVLDERLVHRGRIRAGTPVARLRPREQRILGLVAQGLTNAAIGERLVITEKSVEKALSATYERLGLARDNSAHHLRVQAVLAFLRDVSMADLNRAQDTAHPVSPTPHLEVQPSLPPARSEDTAVPHSIVLVDDQPLFLEEAKQLLATDGRLTVVATATSGAQAVALLPTVIPEIMVIDVQMPGMNGFQTAQAVHAVAPGVRIVMTSSEQTSMYAATADQLGFAFIPKRRLTTATLCAYLGDSESPADGSEAS
ncbi:MAG: response regulator [Chloroflexi bacterium]|nr:response regulator [Chloroflexota bacterium]